LIVSWRVMTARMTRRSLFAATAGAAVGELVRPAGSVAALVGANSAGSAANPAVFDRSVGSLPAGGTGLTVRLSRNADLLGVRWSGAPGARVELRFGDGRGSWSRWVAAGIRAHVPEGAPTSEESVGDPVWTGGSYLVQLRANRSLERVSLSCVDVSDGVGAHRQSVRAQPVALAAALPLATPVLPAGSGQPPILARSGWARGMGPPKVAPEYGTVEMAFVHHTENPNGYSPGEVPAILRAIYAFHRYVRGWDDIGYNFVIDLYGRIFEARAGGIDEPVAGAQAGGYNLVSTGVAVLGEFMSTPISPAAARALRRLLAWKLSLHGIPCRGRVTVRVNPAGAAYSRFSAGTHVSLPRIAGHRDADTTDCPGNVLYGELPLVRSHAEQLAGRPAVATLALGGPVAPSSQPSSAVGATAPGARTPAQPSSAGPRTAAPGQSPQSSQARVLTGRLTRLDGTPIAGAPMAIQARNVSRRGEVVLEATLAQTVTDAEGGWSLPAVITSPGPATWLRALCPGTKGVPAAVSDPLRAAGTVSLTAAPAPVQAPAPAPAPTPPAAPPPST
jgi:hypothetical protein